MPTQEIPVSDAQAGMITANDILDDEGRILIHKGSRLSPVAIRRLPLWGITTILIESTEESESSSKIEFNESSDHDSNHNIDTALISEVALKVKNRFRGVDQDEFYKNYMTVLLRYLVNNNNNGNGILPGFY